MIGLIWVHIRVTWGAFSASDVWTLPLGTHLIGPRCRQAPESWQAPQVFLLQPRLRATVLGLRGDGNPFVTSQVTLLFLLPVKPKVLRLLSSLFTKSCFHEARRLDEREEKHQ